MATDYPEALIRPEADCRPQLELLGKLTRSSKRTTERMIAFVVSHAGEPKNEVGLMNIGEESLRLLTEGKEVTPDHVRILLPAINFSLVDDLAIAAAATQRSFDYLGVSDVVNAGLVPEH